MGALGLLRGSDPWAIRPRGVGDRFATAAQLLPVSIFAPACRMKRGELFDYLTEKVTLSEKETR